MKAFSRLFAGIFKGHTMTNDQTYREWDRLRSKAMSPSELSEIDAIFARHL